MALDLAQLEDIKVKQCPIMEQIIKKGAEETEMVTLLLPMLKKIRLESCSRLTSFCMGSITLQCPSLYEIAVDDCPKMYALASKREQEDIEVVGREKIPFFNHKVLCANLQYLELSSTNIKKLWPDKPDRAISSNKKIFTKGQLSTPMVLGVQNTKGEYVGRWEGNLIATTQQLFIEKMGDPLVNDNQ
ncbi:hypothetical protein GOBAR_DD11945 [Gossypium barbadense]|nr:hypothetical protein GOBAR_DD11945 [Gossypium barbadense]